MRGGIVLLVLGCRCCDAYVERGSCRSAPDSRARRAGADSRVATGNAYKVDLGTPRIPSERLVDLYFAPLPSAGPRGGQLRSAPSPTEDRQSRTAAPRSSCDAPPPRLASMLAHEIKNPYPLPPPAFAAPRTALSSRPRRDRTLTRAILLRGRPHRELVDRMAVFTTAARSNREPVNIPSC